MMIKSKLASENIAFFADAMRKKATYDFISQNQTELLCFNFRTEWISNKNNYDAHHNELFVYTNIQQME